MNLFKKKRPKTIITNEDDDKKVIKIESTVQKQNTQKNETPTQVKVNNDKKSSENSYTSLQNDLSSNFSSKKKKAPPPPPPLQQKTEEKEETRIELAKISTQQSHKKKQAPLPPPLQRTHEDEIDNPIENTKVIIEPNLPTKFNSSTNSNSTTGTSFTNDTITNSDKVVMPLMSKNTNSDNKIAMESEQDLCNTNSLTSSLASSKNCYHYEITANDSLSMSDNENEEAIYTKVESICNSHTQTMSSYKYDDDYSISKNNSKSSSMDDLTKSFALTIAVAEQYVAKDEALKAASLTKKQLNSELEFERNSETRESNSVKSYEDDKNKIANSNSDDFSDIEVKIDLISNDSLNTTVNTNNKENSDTDVDMNMDSNRRDFVNTINSIINKNNHEIENIYETYNKENPIINKNREFISKRQSVEQIVSKDVSLENLSPKAPNKLIENFTSPTNSKMISNDPEWANYEDVELIKQKNKPSSTRVVYRNNLPSPPLTLLSSPDSYSFNYRHSDFSSPQLSLPSPDSSSSYSQRQSTPPVEHSSYKVIRPSDVYEKDGAFYSHDGTIRGYLGTVKKIATSKTLSEIFLHNNKDNETTETQKSIQSVKVTQSPPTPSSPQILKSISSQSASLTPNQKPKLAQETPPPSPQISTTKLTDKTIEEKTSRNSSYNLIHTSTGNHDYKQFNANSKPLKTSLATILASEKKTGNVHINSNNNSTNIVKSNLTSSSLTNIPANIATIPAKLTTSADKQEIIKKSSATIENIENTIVKTNINLSHLHNNNTNTHHHQPQQKMSPSFVMSAKNKSNINTNNKNSVLLGTTSGPKETLVIDIKNEDKKSINSDNIFPSPPPPELYLTLPLQQQQQQDQISPNNLTFPPPPPPPIAPKNISLKSINNKTALVTAYENRSNLLDAIKNYKATNLRKANVTQK